MTEQRSNPGPDKGPADEPFRRRVAALDRLPQRPNSEPDEPARDGTEHRAANGSAPTVGHTDGDDVRGRCRVEAA